MFKQLSILLAAFAFSASTQATLIDFTDKSWQTAITSGNSTTAAVDDVTLTAIGGGLTFNARDKAGCEAGQGIHNLACDGDGIGVNSNYGRDDQINGSTESIEVSFAGPVNILEIYLLDLYSFEIFKWSWSETAIIDGIKYKTNGTNFGTGGFAEIDYSDPGLGITSLLFSGTNYWFNDYALAGINIELSSGTETDVALSPVPIPGAAILFGSALLGFFGFKRRRAV